MPTPRRFAILALALVPALAGCAAPAAPAGPADPIEELRTATFAWSTPEAAEAAGYKRYSPYVDHHGMHYRNKDFANGVFDASKPPVLVFVMDEDGSLRLGAVEYSLPRTTNVPPEGFPGADDVWGVHEASCHFKDGKSFPEKDRTACPALHPESQADFAIWHDDQWTLHVWAHIPNPAGTFKPANPSVR